MADMNALEQYRKQNKQTYASIGRLCELRRDTVLRHCKGERPISGEAALRYHIHLGIPLCDLRPDLYRDGPVLMA